MRQENNDLAPLILWNPAIRMSMTLPQPSCIDVPIYNYYCVYGFGFDHITNDYKVLRMVFHAYKSFLLRAELYKLRTGSWETVGGVDNFQYVAYRGRQALVNGASHWIGCHKSYMPIESRDFSEFVVVLFHMCHEEFRVMKLPDRLSNFRSDDAILKVSDGLLSLFIKHRHASLSCNIWLMKEYGVVESWSKQYTLDLEGWCFERMYSFRNNKKILGTEREKPFLYDPETDIFTSLGNLRMKDDGFFFTTSTFVESLVLLNQVNALQTCQTCLKKAGDATQRKERKRIEKEDMQKDG
ncbi:F-box protein CPR1-like [Corylus avellana]|uniref:F-box protein CPR1-like n=1 Tax=Corylus avellana TaxID=13451 RepID=UPI00286A8F73|nr:F-box protein CPR1-like [Corylus avellana]